MPRKNHRYFIGLSQSVLRRIEKKYCPVCDVWKCVQTFTKNKSRWDGVNGLCKPCYNVRRRQTRSTGRYSAKEKEYQDLHRDERKVLDKLRYEQHKPEIIARCVAYNRKKYKEDPCFRLRHLVSSRINKLLRKRNVSKVKGTMEFVGCTLNELCAHIECQFVNGMHWDNRAEWHIDHVRPCKSFDLTCLEQQRMCFHYTNLQPLWAKDNLKKSAFYDPLTFDRTWNGEKWQRRSR
jgi:hypothetical protein